MNRLYYGDNLDVLREHMADYSVDLVYLDPPFNSNRSYNVIFARHAGKGNKVGNGASAQIQAFDDTWRWTPVTEQQYQQYTGGWLPNQVADVLMAFRLMLGENDALAYLVNMAPRLVELHRVLKRTGSLYLHCDPTMSHYLKVMLDAVFGAEAFRNEIIWKRTGAHGSAKRYAPVHDVILHYGASVTGVTWNGQYHPYEQSYLDEKYRHHDERGSYQLITLFPTGVRHGETGKPWRGIDPTEKNCHWRHPPGRLDQLDAEGMIYWGKNGNRLPRLKRYLQSGQGVPVQDIWIDVPPINSQAAERLGYPTQKPLTLLERIISASSNEGDVVLDPFCGCGTTIDAAQRLGRQWIGIDVTFIAIDLIEKRLYHIYGAPITGSYQVSGIPRDLASARALFEGSPFDFERWAVSRIDAQPNERQVGDKGVDGVVRFYLDKSTTGRILVSVKGGKTVGPQFVRDLIGTVQTQKAQMGVLITMAEPTPGVIDAVNHGGTYRWPLNGQVFPMVQVITIKDLLAGKRPDMPQSLLPYIQAAKAIPPAPPQMSFDDVAAASG
jgi:site-specific DNA-methyltransferase (adenine-specific)